MLETIQAGWFDSGMAGRYNALRHNTGSWRISLQEGFEVGRAAIYSIYLPFGNRLYA